jgi:hypothetical protein
MLFFVASNIPDYEMPIMAGITKKFKLKTSK